MGSVTNEMRRIMIWTISDAALNFITQQNCSNTSSLPLHMVSILQRSQIKRSNSCFKNQTFSYVAVLDLDKIHSSHKYIRLGPGMLLPDVCAAPCDQHIKYIGKHTKLRWYHITLSFFQDLQSSPKTVFMWWQARFWRLNLKNWKAVITEGWRSKCEL